MNFTVISIMLLIFSSLLPDLAPLGQVGIMSLPFRGRVNELPTDQQDTASVARRFSIQRQAAGT
jgi:hypothetical protein